MIEPIEIPPARHRNPTTNRTVIVVAIVIVVLGLTNIVLQVTSVNAVRALRTSSSRSECRTRVTNDAEDQNRHDNAQLFVDVSDLIKQANANNLAAATVTLGELHDLARQMKEKPSVQSLIDKHCPKPLVQPPAT